MTILPSAPVVNFLAGPYLDRRSDERELPEAIARARAQPGSRVLLAQGTALAVTGDPPRAAFFSANEPSLQQLPDSAFILLGWYEQEPCLLLPLTADFTPDLPSVSSWRFEELRPLAATLERHEAGLLAYARALAYWQMRHRHCGRCTRRAAGRSALRRGGPAAVEPARHPDLRGQSGAAQSGLVEVPPTARVRAGQRTLERRSELRRRLSREATDLTAGLR